MSKLFVRHWKAIDPEELGRHLLVMGDSTGNCENCKELGLDPWKHKECPKCHTTFHFITSRRFQTHPGERFHFVRRVLENRSDLQIIDYEDYFKSVGAQKARDFFKS